jgi:lysine-N-methylase
MESKEAITSMVGTDPGPRSGPPTTSGQDLEGMPPPPTYAAGFRCIGASCEDTCCGTWNIPLDKKTYEQYRRFPFEKLGSLVAQYVSIAAPGTHENLFAQINTTPSGSCPFFTSERMCGIQHDYGGQFLSATCSLYPRVLNLVSGVLEGSLTLSCPEAARNVLLVPDSTQIAGDLLSGNFRTDNYFSLTGNGSGSIYKPYSAFHIVRAWLIDMVKDRSRPMWQRLLLIGSLCKQLSEITTAKEGDIVPAILSDYRQILGTKWGQVEMENMPSSCELKLRVIFRLTDERVREKTCGSRFVDTYWNFVEGIGSPAGSMPGDDIQRYLEAEERYHRPFFEQRPFILENYLLNYMFSNLFPFGREGSVRFTPRSIFDEYILMTTQFAWINGLLIGIAGRYKEAFAEEHVVRAIQSYSREVDHDVSIPASIIEFMRSNGLDNLQGMAVMLKN